MTFLNKKDKLEIFKVKTPSNQHSNFENILLVNLAKSILLCQCNICRYHSHLLIAPKIIKIGQAVLSKNKF